MKQTTSIHINDESIKYALSPQQWPLSDARRRISHVWLWMCQVISCVTRTNPCPWYKHGMN